VNKERAASFASVEGEGKEHTSAGGEKRKGKGRTWSGKRETEPEERKESSMRKRGGLEEERCVK